MWRLRSRRDQGFVTRSPKPVAGYTGVRSASCKCPQRPESSPGDDVAAQGANLRVVPLGAHRGPMLAVTGWTRRVNAAHVRRVNAAHVTMSLEVTTAPTDGKARLRAAVCMGK